MSSFKKLNKADVTSVSYAANKQWSFSYNTDVPNDDYIVYYLGRNTPFKSGNDGITNNQYSSLVYDQINHLFYQSFTSSLNTGSLMFNVDTYTSASQQRPTASYFNYNTNPLLIKQFPTGNLKDIEVYSINQNIYGSKILPGSFQISSSANGWLIKDDGNGNLYDAAHSNLLIGNIFYAHGIVINLDPLFEYTGLFENSTFSFQNEHIIYENEVRCIVKESDYNLSYNPSLQSDPSGSLYGFATSASFYPYATTIGLYNDDNDLLMVAKLGKPIMMSPNTDMTFIVKYDT